MITIRLVRAVGSERAIDGLDPAELRAWLVELRTTLAPVSVAGYVRTLRVLGNWLAAEGLAEARGLRGLGTRRATIEVLTSLPLSVRGGRHARQAAGQGASLDFGDERGRTPELRLSDLLPERIGPGLLGCGDDA